MTIKLFIAFLVFYLNTGIRTITVPPPNLPFRICLLWFLLANRARLHSGKEERRKDVAGY